MWEKKSSFHAVAHWGQMILVLLLGVLIYQQNYFNAFQLVGLLGFSQLMKQVKTPIVQSTDSLYISVGVINAWGWVQNWYRTSEHFDDVIHLLTTFTITLFLGYLFLKYLPKQVRQLGIWPLKIASFGVTLGSLWEVAEWYGFMFIESEVQTTMADTITDIVMDSFGAIAGGYLSYWLLLQQKKFTVR
jgi:hypothetical protein